MHLSGQWIKAIHPLFVGEQTSQAFGSGLTFMKRYALCSLVGVAADTDDDANIADGNQVQFQNGKRVNPNVNRPEDFVDKAEYEGGPADLDHPVNNIPRGNPELKKLGKK